ncbi:MAG TPA: hypothetical protein VM869_26295 [Enhygromyxa sp.]|nr:hypothetical protein [Enhygromyxa sp.]
MGSRLEVLAIESNTNLEERTDVSPLSIRASPAQLEPSQLLQDDVFAAEHGELQILVELSLLSPIELTFTHRTWRWDEHVDLDDGALIDDVEAAMLGDRLHYGFFDHIEIFTERARKFACMKRSKLGDDVDVVGRPWLSMDGAGQRASDRPLDAELIENLGDPIERHEEIDLEHAQSS